jgi:BirA family biotin operon repressor/biotin-[acetyl-CoA-carboxylase] ligase
MAAGLAIVEVLASRWRVNARLKWPNDVLVDGRKLAGILSEVAPGASDGSVAVALGIGINLTVEGFPDGVAGVSLHTLVDEAPDAETLLLALGGALRTRIAQVEAGALAAIVDDWRRHATGLGMTVTVTSPSGTFEGVAIDIADDGGLLVESGGVVRHVLAGDVHLNRSPTG